MDASAKTVYKVHLAVEEDIILHNRTVTTCVNLIQIKMYLSKSVILRILQKLS